MKNISLILVSLMMLLFANCKKEKMTENPFFGEYTTPFGVPPFDKIDTTHYMPAFIEGMKQQNAEIDALVSNPNEPDFDNTILAFDRSGLMLTRVRRVFSP